MIYQTDYIESVIQQMLYYKKIAEKTFAQLPDEQLFWQYNEASNSVATLVKHLSGNMLSRWTDFLTTDGEKEWRNRDAEFENDIKSRQQLMDVWDDGWKCLISSLNSITDADLERIVYIRNQGHTVAEAINRSLAHYPYHIGQIVFIGKMVRDAKWYSLTIPKGGSQQFNENKFSTPKHLEHFTQEFLRANGNKI